MSKYLELDEFLKMVGVTHYRDIVLAKCLIGLEVKYRAGIEEDLNAITLYLTEEEKQERTYDALSKYMEVGGSLKGFVRTELGEDIFKSLSRYAETVPLPLTNVEGLSGKSRGVGAKIFSFFS